jgi:hypothetical protein
MTEAIWRCGRSLVLLAFSASVLCWVHSQFNTAFVSINSKSVGVAFLNCNDGVLFGVTHQSAGFGITTGVRDNDDNER